MDNHARVIPLTREHCALMAEQMRPADRLELSLLGDEPDTYEARLKALTDLLGRSRGLARAGFYGDRLVNIWGVMTRTIIAPVGHPWMATTEAVSDRRVRRAMAHRCRAEFLGAIPDGVSHLWNVVYSENDDAIRWLRWMNFQFDPDPVEHNGARWFKFEMRGE